MSDDLPGAGQTAFIISPIGDKLSPRGTPARLAYEENVQMWEQVFEPACKELGLEAIRADKISEPGEIPEQIFVHLRTAPVVIADVTGGNPNVMYELGLRHTRDLITVQVGQHGRLPFDISTIRTIQFQRTEGGLIELHDALVTSLRAALEGRGSPVAATRVWNTAEGADAGDVAAAVAASQRPDDDEGEPDEPGVVDILAEGEQSVVDMRDVLERASAYVVEVGNTTQGYKERVEASDAKGGGFAGRLRLTRELAAELKEPAQSLEEEAADFVSEVGKLDAMVRYIIGRYREEEMDDAERASVRSFLYDNIIPFIDAAEGSEEGIRGMLRGVLTMRKSARDLTPVSKTLERALNQMLRGIAMFSEWRSLIEDEDEGDVGSTG